MIKKVCVADDFVVFCYLGKRCFAPNGASEKERADCVLEFLQKYHLIYALLVVVVLVAALRLLDFGFRFYGKKTKRGPAIHVNFLKACLKALFVIIAILQIGSQYAVVEKFYSSILMSSSLIVVVLGFVMQEGISNIVHGFIISVFKPFELGDRIRVLVDGQEITGYVEAITLRNTVIRNVVSSALVIVPNAKMDLAIIENSTYSQKNESTNFIDVCVTYKSDIDLACRIISEEISSHPLFCKKDPERSASEMVPVMARELNERGVALRAFMVTNTIEENFAACSDVRKSIARRIQETPGVAFAYNRVRVNHER